MDVNPVGHSVALGASAAPRGGAVPNQQEQTEPVEPAVEGATVETGRAHGALHLLQEGHFQGVADVRLRINFAEDLQIVQGQAAVQSFAGGADSVLGAVDTVIKGFLDQADLDPETANQIDAARVDFRAAVQTLFDSATDSGSSDVSGLVASLQQAFQDFLETLEPLVPASAPEPAESSAIDVSSEDAAVTPAVTAANFLDALTSAFNDSVASLQSNVQTVSGLPPVSEPNGNGVAYARFLSILNDLTGSSPVPTDTQVDTIA